LIDKKVPVIFHFAGTLISELSAKVKSHAVLHGQISDAEIMGKLLFDADIALLTSVYEGFPMFIKESMAHGCIPVVTALPGNRMHLTDRSNALLIHDFTEEESVVKQGVENITALADDPESCKRLSLAAYVYAAEHFTRVDFNHKYRNLLTPAV
jgi:glycosyltransferase involved in cell wall biosynthesis